MRKVKNIIDKATGEAVYILGHALATYMSDGRTVEEAVMAILEHAVTEETVAEWGFTKNTGTYSKPSSGIPEGDLASDVRTSLGKAKTALQSYTEKYTGTYTKPNGGIPKSDLSSDVQTSLGKANTALQSEQYKGTVTAVKMNGSTKSPSNGVVDLGNVVIDVSGKQDKLVSSVNVRTINGVSILGSGNITIATGVDSNYVNDAITNAVTNALNTAV